MAHIDIAKLTSGDLLTLSRAITLVESQKPNHRADALALISEIYNPSSRAIRIGITGIPGVGKSTFIEQLGMEIIARGHKLAVLAIDPSSSKSGGSILGDKTRMETLSRHPAAYIRPSASGGTLGGVAARTREAMLLCEAAGFDVVIVETVGVGQSETEVIQITDCFLMLAMPGTGDDLQGIKRGIMEAADIITINKADGHNADAAMRAKKQLEMALHLFPKNESGWSTKVITASAINGKGIKETWEMVCKMIEQMQLNGHFEKKRQKQQMRSFDNLVSLGLYEYIAQKINASEHPGQLRKQIESGALNEYSAAEKLIRSLGNLGI